MRRTRSFPYRLLVMFAVVAAGVALADDEPVRLIDASGTQSARILAQLQSQLSRTNPDAVILWCPIVLRGVTDEPRRHSDRFGAACHVQDGVAPRHLLLCDDSTATRFAAMDVPGSDDRLALGAFIETHCPEAD